MGLVNLFILLLGSHQLGGLGEEGQLVLRGRLALEVHLLVQLGRRIAVLLVVVDDEVGDAHGLQAHGLDEGLHLGLRSQSPGVLVVEDVVLHVAISVHHVVVHHHHVGLAHLVLVAVALSQDRDDDAVLRDFTAALGKGQGLAQDNAHEVDDLVAVTAEVLLDDDVQHLLGLGAQLGGLLLGALVELDEPALDGAELLWRALALVVTDMLSP